MKKQSYYVFDGGLGTMLQSHGLSAGACPEEMNMNQPDAVFEVHKLYVDAGADIISTNTFGGNRLKLEEYGLADQVFAFNKKAAEIAKKAAGTKAMVAGSIGPTGYFLRPLGQMSFEEAYQTYKEQIEGLVAGGSDLLLFETFNDLGELRAGIIAAKDVCDLPIIASLTYENEKTLTGVSADAAAAILEALGVYAIGANCSGGPKELLSVIKTYREISRLPIMVQPNAGMPELKDGEVYFPLDAKAFIKEMEPYFPLGVTFFGSCCGSNPEHTAEYVRVLPEKIRLFTEKKEEHRKFLASKSVIVETGSHLLPKMIGERINPTARKKLAGSLLQNELSYLQDEAYLQTEQGAHLLDINLGLPGINQKEIMREAVSLIQQSIDTPLVIDSTDPEVIEEALKYYQGKALINSVNGEASSMEAILPLAKRYGAAIIALTLDENGIPETKEGRLQIARRIMDRAAKEGINKENIYVDCLVMTVGTNDLSARETIETVKLVKKELGLGVVLGVSNVSHGLPVRGKLNGAFLAVAIYHGLDLAIVNPDHPDITNAWEAASLIAGRDVHAGNYLQRNSGAASAGATDSVIGDLETDDVETVARQVVRGSGQIIKTIATLLENGIAPLTIINQGLIAGLDEVGRKFESGEFYLPQLMLSAEVSQKAFDFLESELGEEHKIASKGTIVIGTVKGDVHDIGKNMVGVMIKNHGYQVIDLGKNVSAEEFLAAVEQYQPDFVGLSALMTTTMTQIPEVISHVRMTYPKQRFLCGGAVVTQAYSEESGANGYCKDAAHTIRVIEKLKEEGR